MGITKCDGDNCKKKEKCYRYTSEPSEYWQSYFRDIPFNKGENCFYFWPLDTDDLAPKVD